MPPLLTAEEQVGVESVLADLDRLLAGDLTVRFTVHADGACAGVVERLNRLAENLENKLVKSTLVDVNKLVGTMADLFLKVEDLNPQLQSQSDSLAQIAAADEEITSSIEEVAASTRDVLVGAEDSAVTAAEGRQQVHSIIGQMQAIVRANEATRGRAVELQERTREISGVINLIKEVADQTNLLALNAAIEAARAGDHGRGFAVVADEVRKLAESTKKSVRDITDKIKLVQEQVGLTAEEANSSTEKAREGEELSHQTGSILDRIVTVSERTKEQMEEVAAATDQQSHAATDLAARSQEILTVLQKSAQDVNRASQGTLAVNSILEALRAELARYHIDMDTELTLELSKTDHYLWRQRVHALLAGHLELRPEQVGSHRDCRFGKWYSGDGQARFGSDPVFGELDEPHQEVHRLARAIAEAHAQRDTKKAIVLIQELDRHSERLVAGLDRLKESAKRHRA